MNVHRTIPAVAERPIALTIGNFDGVHLGHQAMLRRLRDAATALGVPACVMTFEPHPREFFAPDQAPTRLTSLREKLELLERSGVDHVYICRFNFDFARVSAPDFIQHIVKRGLDVRWLLVGDDFRFGARRAGDGAMLRAAGRALDFEVAEMPSVEVGGLRVSSTAIRDLLAAGRLDEAARILGRPYSISGRVVRGDRIGRELGFPTANLQMKHNRPPLYGIYIAQMHGLPEGPLRGAASLGVRPTVAGVGKPVLEIHLLDFDREIYGAHVRIEFLERLREERKYANLRALARQIALDVDEARAWFDRREARRLVTQNG
ncbi:MAG: bifunctional riboflavin kinase/FAD synthetase [Burkholderiales bacterium]|nr:bifunctional riboflavin kinase/FAD synthetase [Burkholderiales bacterium]